MEELKITPLFQAKFPVACVLMPAFDLFIVIN